MTYDDGATQFLTPQDAKSDSGAAGSASRQAGVVQKIGVFDSGVGGLSMARAIQKELPGAEILLKSDKQHFPYGNRELDEIYNFTKPLVMELVEAGCQVIVIACNTVTTNFIKRLRDEIKVPLVGMEPMIKPAAAASRSGVICVCATPRTLASDRYAWLKEQFAKNIEVLEPDCSDWAFMIETNTVDRAKIAAIVEDACAKGADQIVLACTHYHWIEQMIRELAAGRAEIMQPEAPVIRQLKKVIAENGI